MGELLKCLECGEPVFRDQDGKVTHVFSGQEGCTYRSHL